MKNYRRPSILLYPKACLLLGACLYFANPIHASETSASIEKLCAQTVLNYADYSDSGQRDKFNALFTKEGELITTARTRKPFQTKPGSENRPPRTQRHVTTNHIVRQEGGELTGTSYYSLWTSPEVSDTPLPIDGQPVMMGVYYDTYVIEDGSLQVQEANRQETL
jgi:hypothetical protein